jgi:hypothetical protein
MSRAGPLGARQSVGYTSTRHWPTGRNCATSAAHANLAEVGRLGTPCTRMGCERAHFPSRGCAAAHSQSAPRISSGASRPEREPSQPAGQPPRPHPPRPSPTRATDPTHLLHLHHHLTEACLAPALTPPPARRLRPCYIL